MATLILTDEEKAEPVWSNLSDEARGKMVKRNMALFRASADKRTKPPTWPLPSGWRAMSPRTMP